MISTRRTFLKTGTVLASAATTGMLAPSIAYGHQGSHTDAASRLDDSELKALVHRGIDAARSAGAVYTDVRLTHQRKRSFNCTNVTCGGVHDTEALTVGIRALVDGYWGFSSSPLWKADEMVRLGVEAVSQAKSNALGRKRVVELASTPVVADGSWVLPVRIDPFTVHPVEIVEHLMGLGVYAGRTPGGREIGNRCEFTAQDKAFGSSEGSYFTQRTYEGSGFFTVALDTQDLGGREIKGYRSLRSLRASAIGWELYRDQPIRDQIDQAYEEIRRDSMLPVKAVDVGRFDTVLSALAVASVLNGTVGAATELDRAMGYEANASGTSYLNQPLEMAGTHKLGSPMLTVTGNRSDPGSLGWVKWDDEGVPPESFTIVDKGIVTDFSTTRESATWLNDYYAGKSMPVRSRGCAGAAAGDHVPLTYTPNLVMQPGQSADGVSDLVATLDKGLEFTSLDIDVDFQQLNGFGTGEVYEITKGKRTAIVAGVGMLFRSPEFWKSIKAIGGEASAERFPAAEEKGEPAQSTRRSITAVPALVKGLAIIDPRRKA